MGDFTATLYDPTVKHQMLLQNEAGNNNARRVCIIGAGVSGLPAIKCCLDEGLVPVCFEATADIGGLWNYRELGEGHSTVMKSTVVNTSKEMMAYSDFPPPADYPNFMHNTLVNKYLHSYAEEFDLMKHIRLNTAVLKVRQAPDYERTGGWIVHTSDQQMHYFDAVMVATGHHAKQYLPKFNGVEKFKGHVLHSQSYLHPQPFEGENVLVVGIGNSGIDAAVDLVGRAKQVHLSTRRGTWVWHRVGEGGMPFDIVYQNRMYYTQFKFFPQSLASDVMELKLNKRMDHEMYGLKPKHRFWSAHPTVNDALPNLLASGKIVIQDDIEDFTEKTVKFVGGNEAQIDTVIASTGYYIDFPFIAPASLVPVKDNQLNLYKFVFPPDLAHPTLSFIGYVQPFGAIQPISEMQCRWVTRVLAGYCKLPTVDAMQCDIEAKRKAMARRYVKSQRHTVQVDYVTYMDEIAQLIDCAPPLWSTFFTDFFFWMSLVHGPNVPYVYRLRGPHSWKAAKQTIVSTLQRVTAPLRTRQSNCVEQSYRNKGMRALCSFYTWEALWTLLVVLVAVATYFGLGYAADLHSPWLFGTFLLFALIVYAIAFRFLHHGYQFSIIF